MSYAWTGAPAVFNGTDAVTGGDSGEYPLMLLERTCRARTACIPEILGIWHIAKRTVTDFQQ